MKSLFIQTETAIIGLLCLFIGTVFGPIFLVAAIFGFMSASSGGNALAMIGKLQEENPNYKLKTSAKGNASIGLIIGGIELTFGGIYLAYIIAALTKGG